MFCSKCGAQMDDTAIACPKCGAPVTRPQGEVVPNHLVGAILTTIFCCQIGGIVAIIYSCMVNTKLANGDVEGARKASGTAKTWIIVNICVGVVGAILYALIVLAGVLAEA